MKDQKVDVWDWEKEFDMQFPEIYIEEEDLEFDYRVINLCTKRVKHFIKQNFIPKSEVIALKDAYEKYVKLLDNLE